MYAISLLFLGVWFKGLIGAEALDYVKMPFGLDLAVGAQHGAGTVVLYEGEKMLAVPLWRSYLAGCILLGIAPCTAMVLVWGYLSKGNDGHTLVMVAINSLTMLVLYGVLGRFLLGVGRLPIPWQALLLSIGVYVALPLVAGSFSRKWIIASKGEKWFKEKFLHVLTPITIIALLITLILLFSFKGNVILSESPHHPVDCHTTVYSDKCNFLVNLLLSKMFGLILSRCRSIGHDRGIKPFRGSYCDGSHVVRFIVGGLLGYRRWSANRSSFDVDACQDMPANPALVSCEVDELLIGH